jgi:hypothetical protein
VEVKRKYAVIAIIAIVVVIILSHLFLTPGPNLLHLTVPKYASVNSDFGLSGLMNLTSNGKFYFSMIITSGNTLTNVSLACNLGNNPLIFTNISSLGQNPTNNTFFSDSIIQVDGLQCYNESGSPLRIASNFVSGQKYYGPYVFVKSGNIISKAAIVNIQKKYIFNPG